MLGQLLFDQALGVFEAAIHIDEASSLDGEVQRLTVGQSTEGDGRFVDAPIVTAALETSRFTR